MRNNAVDVLVVAGDVFDISAPANDTQGMYFHFLKQVSAICPDTIIISGNHDSPSLLDVPKPFLNEFGIHVVGTASQPDDELVILHDDNDNSLPPRLIVAVVPFLRDRDIRKAVEGESFEESENRTIAGIKAHYDAVCAAAEQVRRQFPEREIPLLATGHLFVSGIASPGSIREIHVGALGQLGCDIFPAGIDYVALGHIHRPSNVGGRENVRYSGSPIPMNFDEARQDKSVVLVEFEGRSPKIEVVPIPRFANFHHVEGNLHEICGTLEALEKHSESDERDCFVEVVYTGAEPIHDLVRQVEDAVKSDKVEIVRISQEREKTENNRHLSFGENLENLSETDVFDRLLDDEEKKASPLDTALKTQLQKAYRELLAQCQENS